MNISIPSIGNFIIIVLIGIYAIFKYINSNKRIYLILLLLSFYGLITRKNMITISGYEINDFMSIPRWILLMIIAYQVYKLIVKKQ